MVDLPEPLGPKMTLQGPRSSSRTPVSEKEASERISTKVSIVKRDSSKFDGPQRADTLYIQARSDLSAISSRIIASEDWRKKQRFAAEVALPGGPNRPALFSPIAKLHFIYHSKLACRIFCFKMRRMAGSGRLFRSVGSKCEWQLWAASRTPRLPCWCVGTSDPRRSSTYVTTCGRSFPHLRWHLAGDLYNLR